MNIIIPYEPFISSTTKPFVVRYLGRGVCSSWLQRCLLSLIYLESNVPALPAPPGAWTSSRLAGGRPHALRFGQTACQRTPKPPRRQQPTITSPHRRLRARKTLLRCYTCQKQFSTYFILPYSHDNEL